MDDGDNDDDNDNVIGCLVEIYEHQLMIPHSAMHCMNDFDE